ncbi:unnamed protein product [Adineta steineri]|uniref:Uncharacterized protein n=1 Tax=Adineta steineri TaxID=433720 RepID=A0A814WV28_9BILA|nr:unnamed protein product [Adineta steineri]CAF1476931.1 unnamed protein product [Adineta steineri]
MATNTENSLDGESVVIDNNEGTNSESSRTTTRIKSTVFVSNNHPLDVIEKGVHGSFVTVNQSKHFGFIKRTMFFREAINKK